MNDSKTSSGSPSFHDGADLEKRPSVYKDLIVTSVKDVPDDAAIATAAVSGMTISTEEAKRLVRKIDRNLMPLLCLTYLIQFLDKISLGYAAIMGIRKDNNISLAQYSWLSSIFYIGYLVGEWPTNVILQKFPLAKWLAFNIIVWGVILALTAVTHEFIGLLVVRFFLGLFEASITPGFSLITSQWYLKSEQGTRTGIWFSCNGMAGIFGSIMAWGFARSAKAGDFVIPGWKVLFLFLGAFTVFLGFLLLWRLPDSPLTARWLTPDERIMAVERIRSNNMGIGNKTWKFYQFKEALLDPLVWLYCLVAICLNIPNGGFTNFFGIIITSMGYDPITALLYGMPSGAITMFFVVLLMYLGDKTHRRIICGIVGCLIGLLGLLLVWQLPSSMKAGRLMGYYMNSVAIVGFITVLSLVSSNVAGSTKKSTATAMLLISYSVGNLIGPQTFRAQDAPRYNIALIVATSTVCTAIASLLGIWAINVRENKRKAAIVNAPGYVARQNQEFLDLTDRENPAFVYTC